jgi:hypothetical protein
MRSVCYLCAVICTDTEVTSGIENARDKEFVSVCSVEIYTKLLYQIRFSKSS